MDFRMYDFGRSDITKSCRKEKSTLNTAAYRCEAFNNFEQKKGPCHDKNILVANVLAEY